MRGLLALDDEPVLVPRAWCKRGRAREVARAAQRSGVRAELWQEPQPAYNAQYPFNKIIKTASHVIELDDTPDHERIMIHHKEGSFIQIDARGNVTNKAAGDNFDVKEKGQHVYIGGRNIVTIMGHSHVYYDGNVVEEVGGDYTQIVHGNRYIGVGMQSSHNAAEQYQVIADDVLGEARTGQFAIKAKEEVKIQSDIRMDLKGEFIYAQASDTLSLKGDTSLFEGTTSLDIFGETIQQQSSGEFHIKGGEVFVGSDGELHVSGTTVNIDDYVSMAEGNATAPNSALAADDAEDAATPELPEPPARSTATMADKRSRDAGDSGGITSQDDSGVDV